VPLAPYLSVIIPALNEERQIAQTIVAATSPDAEIIVSDGGSTDRTVKIARALGARIVSGKRGRAGQQNRGAPPHGARCCFFSMPIPGCPSNYVDHVFETLMDRRTDAGRVSL
jgi:cellulose synthase/poly-beta-1,6-N-acetylglucosamine synthase-like glycosyltransferase